MFLHENGARSVQMEEKIIKETQKFLAMASKYGLLTDISVRHLFDFDVRSFVDSDRKTNETAFRDYQLEPLTTKVDKYTTWTKASGVDKPIVKLALFSSKDRIQLYEGVSHLKVRYVVIVLERASKWNDSSFLGRSLQLLYQGRI